jgi:hypothetical protein
MNDAMEYMYTMYLETGSSDEAMHYCQDIIEAAIISTLDGVSDYYEELDEWEALIDEAIEVLFENLNSGMTMYEALETDKALRAAIAVSTDLGDIIEDLEDMIDDGLSIDDCYELTEDAFDLAYADVAVVLIEMDELETSFEVSIYAALDELYIYLEEGYTLDEVLDLVPDLYDACDMSPDFSSVVTDLYEYIEAGNSVEDAYTYYEDDISSAVTNAGYLMTDVAIQIVE